MTGSYDTRRKKFLEELSALTKKYKISIDGCGCCGSPFPVDLETSSIEEGFYTERLSNSITFIYPDSEYDWNLYHSKLPKVTTP